jgi:hypothetical protein
MFMIAFPERCNYHGRIHPGDGQNYSVVWDSLNKNEKKKNNNKKTNKQTKKNN